MMTITSADLEYARDEGSFAAARELVRLEIDQTRPIDIFSIIELQGLWLFFAPLDNVLGMYRPGGILVSNRRARSVQRLTGAHEYGHHVLQHLNSLDEEEEIEGIGGRFRMKNPGKTTKFTYLSPQQALEEAAAQSFAMDFLMPPMLINSMWNRLDFPRHGDSLSAHHIYDLSLLLGTSYSATVHQLHSLSRLSTKRMNELLKVTPKEIKLGRNNGSSPANPWADVWSLDASFSGEHLTIGVTDEIHIKLAEAPSTGYVWHGLAVERIDSLTPLPDVSEPFVLLQDDFEPTDSSRTGAGGMHHFKILSGVVGHYIFRVHKVRPWRKDEPIDEFSLEFQVQRPDVQGLPESQKISLVGNLS